MGDWKEEADRQDPTGTARQSNLRRVFKMVGALLLVFSSSLALVAVLGFLKFHHVSGRLQPA